MTAGPAPEARAGWREDFSYGFYRRLVAAACGFLEPRTIGEAATLDLAAGGQLFLRHDIDLSLEAACRMAELEHEMGVRATYFAMMRSPLYDPGRSGILARIAALGHEIGAHVDCPVALLDRPAAIDAAISEDCRRLEDLLGRPVAAVSFHRPAAGLLRGPLLVAGRVNAYAAGLMGWYISDSGGRWRCGDPLAEIATRRHHRLQLLVHPIWWGDRHMPAEDRLQDFFIAATRPMSPDRAAAFDADLAAIAPAVRRRGLGSGWCGG